MANPIVTTIQERDLDNNSAVIQGTNQLNGWEITEWGFWKYKKSEGIGTKTYIGASGTPAEGDFAQTLGLLPYIIYAFQARCYYRKLITPEPPEDPYYEYIEIFGEWLEFTTHAYSTTLQIFTTNINKGTGAVTFWGTIDTPDDGFVIERGFQYGLTKTPTWSVKEKGNFTILSIFSLNATVAPNTDYYVRAYLKTASGHYFYTSYGEDRGWMKFTTKVLTNDIVVISQGAPTSISEDFFRVFDKNGQENNAWKIPSGQGVTEVTVDKFGNAYYGYKIGTSYYIGKRRLRDGVFLDHHSISGVPRGVCIGYGNFLFTLETDTVAKNAILYKRELLNLGEIEHINLTTSYAYFCGITASKYGHVYVGNTTTPRIEMYAMFESYDIIGVSAFPNYNITGVAKHNINGVSAGEAGEGWFKVPGNHVLKFTAGSSIEVAGSTGNDGNYTVKEGGSYYSVGNTVIPVNQEIVDFNEDGTIIKTGDNSFRIAGEYDEDFTEGKQVEIEGSTGNNGTYNISAGGAFLENGNTVVPVDETISDIIIDGTLTEIGECSFTIEGNHIGEFNDSEDITITGSTGNNGTYAVLVGGAYAEGANTVIPINGKITDRTVDGKLTLAENLTRKAYINSPVAFSFGSIGISGDYVYIGAWFDVPARATKELNAIEKYYPAGEWENENFFKVGKYKDTVIIEGTPYIGYSRALASYDEEGIQLWKTDIVRGTSSVSGYPYYGGASLINTKAEKSAGHLYLSGEITEIMASTIVERGFEYLVQDAEPEAEDTGTEVKEEGASFIAEEYRLSSWGTFNDLYRAEENVIWWFRTYCKDDRGDKWVAGSWMKNIPTVTTDECTEVQPQQAKAHGEMTDKGANKVTRRGFRVIKEYVGDLFAMLPYQYSGWNTSLLEHQDERSPEGVLIGFLWVGDLYRDSLWPLSQTPGDFEIGIYENILGGGFMAEAFGVYLPPNDNLKVQAIAVNQLGMGFGEEVELNTGRYILPSGEDEIIGDREAEKTITLGTIPIGDTVTRIGIRLGRTQGCNEIHVYEDGAWGTGGSVTFMITGFVPDSTYYKMPYIILRHSDGYEEEILAIPDYRNPERLEEWLTDYPLEVFPEVEDEDDLDHQIVDSSVGDISYKTIIKEIKCEKIADQSFIDICGRRRSQTINNHLVQARAKCIEIINKYLERFQILKLKVVIDYDIPIPFEREDTVLLGDGKEKYREDGDGLIAFKADGAGEIISEGFILAKIRKANIRYTSGVEGIINIELEV